MLPRAQEIALDAGVVAFIVGLSLLLGAIVGAVPLGQIAAMKLAIVLQEDSRGATSGRTTRLLRRGLVMAQVTLAFVLLIGAGLLLASFRQVLAVHPGFDATHVLTARLNPPATRYAEAPAVQQFVDRLLPRLRTLPGVDAAGVTSALPFSGDADSSVIFPEGYVPKAGESVVSPNQIRASPGYFDALRIPLLRGRLFTESDAAGAPRVAIVDRRLAERFWPGQDPIGRRIYLPGTTEEVANPGPKTTWLQVVGVVGDVKQHGLVDGEGTRVGAYYFPFAQDFARGFAIAVRTRGDASGVLTGMREIVRSLDPELPLYDAMAMPQRVERSLDGRRTPMLLALGFGGVALLLASVGLYGVLAYQVAQRTREIGIRMSLGSDARGILRLVLREGALLVGGGLAIGFLASLGLRVLLQSQLYGVSALDPIVIVTVSVVLGAAAFVACLGPALRAARVNPVVALARR
jgi:predicted permease